MEFLKFMLNECPKLAAIYGDKFDWKNFSLKSYAERGGIFWIARLDGEPVGFLMASLGRSIFDPNVTILFQDSLYVSCKGTRAAHMLLNEFIDFGKQNANHIITCLTPYTNIKRRSVERLGFSKLEELYRMEILK